MKIEPYVFFDGRTRGSARLLQAAPSARETTMLMRYNRSPDLRPGMLPPGSENKVMHASMKIGDATVMCSDGGCAASSRSTASRSRLQRERRGGSRSRRSRRSSQGGQVTMPLGKTFFSPRFGMCTDKFGVGWMVIVAQ
jgi:PhnB protein